MPDDRLSYRINNLSESLNVEVKLEASERL